MFTKLVRTLTRLFRSIPGTELAKFELYLIHDTEPETLLDTLRIYPTAKELMQRKITRFLKKRCPAQVDLAYRYELRIKLGFLIKPEAVTGLHLILGYAIRRLYTPSDAVVNYPIIYRTGKLSVCFTVHSYTHIYDRIA